VVDNRKRGRAEGPTTKSPVVRDEVTPPPPPQCTDIVLIKLYVVQDIVQISF